MDSEGLSFDLSQMRQVVAPLDCQRLTDRQLLDGYLSARDEASFTALVQRHGPMVLRLARRRLRDAHAAEDVFQATFLILACKAQTIRRQDSLSSWLYGVAQRLAARVRQAGKRWESDARRGVPMSQENPEAILTQRELETVLDEELKELSDRFRAPLLLCYLEGQTQDEAARQLGCCKATLRRRLDRGRELLRARLVRRGLTLSLGLLTTALVGRVEAGVLPALIQQTALASVQATNGVTGAVSPHVAALADWGMKTLGVTRKWLMWWLLAATLAAGGSVAAAALAWPNAEPQTPPVAVKFEASVASANERRDREKRAALGSVWSVAYSPDGRLLATGSGDWDTSGRVAVWDVRTGKARLWLEHPRGVRSVDFSPDGKKIATACWDDLVRLYDVRSGKLLAILRGHSGPVNSVAFSPDGQTLASGSLDSTIFLWDVDRGTPARCLRSHTDWVLCIAFFPDGKSLVSSSKDGTVRVWDLESGMARQVFIQPNVTFECVAVSPDGQTMATGGWDHQVRLWNVSTGTCRAVYAHRVGVLSLCFSPDGRTLASVSGNFNEPDGGDLKLWSTLNNLELATLKGHTNSIWSVRFAPDGRTLATASRDQRVKVWEVATGQERLTIDNGLDLLDGKRPEKLTQTELNDIWTALAVPDGEQTHRALGRLVRAPEQAVPWLAERLKAEPKANALDEKRLRDSIARLDDDDFDTRENATAELAKLGVSAATALRKALEGKLSVEKRQRIVGLLDRLSDPARNMDYLRTLRALEALELIDTPEALRLLQQLAEAAPKTAWTQDVEASYRRLLKRH